MDGGLTSSSEASGGGREGRTRRRGLAEEGGGRGRGRGERDIFGRDGVVSVVASRGRDERMVFECGFGVGGFLLLLLLLLFWFFFWF